MMLTRVSPTNDYDEDAQLLSRLGLHPRVPFKDAPDVETAGCASAVTATLQEKQGSEVCCTGFQDAN